ncbi:MAG TPA: hypothetical protein VF153_04800 [Candidatus Limnocylindria bacterium]
MSRAERRAYKRMTKNQDPYALPSSSSAGSGARARAQVRSRPRRRAAPGEFRFISGRFLAVLIGGALVVGLLGFSVAWPNGMPGALYAGLAAGAAWLVLVVAFRFLQQRIAGRPLPPH